MRACRVAGVAGQPDLLPGADRRAVGDRPRREVTVGVDGAVVPGQVDAAPAQAVVDDRHRAGAHRVGRGAGADRQVDRGIVVVRVVVLTARQRGARKGQREGGRSGGRGDPDGVGDDVARLAGPAADADHVVVARGQGERAQADPAAPVGALVDDHAAGAVGARHQERGGAVVAGIGWIPDLDQVGSGRRDGGLEPGGVARGGVGVREAVVRLVPLRRPGRGAPVGAGGEPAGGGVVDRGGRGRNGGRRAEQSQTGRHDGGR